MWRFVLAVYLALTVLIALKHVLLPACLNLLLPISDFRSTLFEVFILIVGVAAGFIYFYAGSLARSHYALKRKKFLFSLVLLFLPQLLPAFEGFSDISFSRWLMLWTDLISEPYRILTLSYQYSEEAGLLFPLLFLLSGYFLQSQESGRHAGQRHPQVHER